MEFFDEKNNLALEIDKLISLRQEGGFWDFKSKRQNK